MNSFLQGFLDNDSFFGRFMTKLGIIIAANIMFVIFSVPFVTMGAGLAVMSYPIMNVFYRGSHEAGPALLALMGAASFFVCILLMENAVLQASGFEKYTMATMISGSLVKIVVNWFLVAQPEINIYGAPVGTLCGYITMCAVNYYFMMRHLEKAPRLKIILVKPFLAAAAMSLAAWAVYTLLGMALGLDTSVKMLICMAGGILAAVAAYLFMTLKLGNITKEDLLQIPKGEKVAKLLHLD